MTLEVPILVALISAGSALGGAVLGWLLKEISESFQRRRTLRGVVNTAIFNLTSIYALIVKIRRLDEFVDAYAQTLNRKYKLATEEQRQTADAHLKQTLVQFLSVDAQSQETETLKRYQEAIVELAKVDPLLAVGLKNNISRLNHLVWFDGMMRNLQAALHEPSTAKVSQTFIETANQMLVTELADDLEEEIVHLARLTGRFSARNVRSALKQGGNIDQSELERVVDQLFSKVIPSVEPDLQ